MKYVSALVIVCLFCGLVTNAGCRRESVDAVPRKSDFEPVFGETPTETVVSKANDLDLSFLNDDHFACFCMDVDKVISNPDLAEVPWDTLEQQLAKWVGPDNSRLSSVDRVWLLLDRESFSMIADGQSSSPGVWIVDYDRPLNEKQLQESILKRNEGNLQISPNESPPPKAFLVQKIGDRRVAFGSRDLIAKLSKKNVSSEISRQLTQLKLDSDIEGVISLAPIRSTLQSIFDMAAQFGGDSYAKFARLPEVTRRIEFKVSLKAKDMLVASVYIDDDELTKEIARMANDTTSQGNSMFGGGLPFGPGGMGGGQPMGSMVPNTTSKLVEEVGKQIKEEHLFSVQGANQIVSFKLQRPNQLKELISASIHDAKRQLEVSERVQKLTAIAGAMREYQDKYGCFPPAGIENGNSEGLPDQFNWRVGLLPFLGEQALYDQFDFNQSWDSEANLKVASQIPEVYSVAGPGDSNATQEDSNATQEDSNAIKTRFHIPGGEFGLYQEDRIPKLSDIVDKKIWTAVIIEGAPQSAVVWTKPGVFPVSQAVIDQFDQFGVDDEMGILFANAAFEARIIKKDREKLRAILTPTGDETLTRRDFLPVALGQ